MVPRRIVQLRFDALFEKYEGFFSVFVQKNSRQPECLMRTKIQHDVLNVHCSPPCRTSCSSLSFPAPVRRSQHPSRTIQMLTELLSFLKQEKLYDR